MHAHIISDACRYFAQFNCSDYCHVIFQDFTGLGDRLSVRTGPRAMRKKLNITKVTTLRSDEVAFKFFLRSFHTAQIKELKQGRQFTFRSRQEAKMKSKVC